MALAWHATNPDMIGGAIVRRPINLGGRTYRSPEKLSRDQVLAIPKRNRDGLCASGSLEPWPISPAGERFLVSAGKGLFDVVEGRRITSEPLSKAEAEALLDPKSRAA